MIVALGLVGVLILVSSPLHRAFWGARVASWLGSHGRPVPQVAASIEPEPAASPATSPRRRRVPLADGAGRIGIPVADRVPWRLPAEGVPSGWMLKKFTGQATIELVRGDPELALHLRSERASFALYRDVLVDLDQTPVLTWAWSVARLPAGGDVRQPGRDDQAAQVYVVFPRWPSPASRSDVIGYVWDTTAPVGTSLTSAKAANVRVVVVASGRDGLGTWRRERRNVRDDYVALFGRRPPRVGSVAVMIDSDDTGGVAEAMISELAFSRS